MRHAFDKSHPPSHAPIQSSRPGPGGHCDKRRLAGNCGCLCAQDTCAIHVNRQPQPCRKMTVVLVHTNRGGSDGAGAPFLLVLLACSFFTAVHCVEECSCADGLRNMGFAVPATCIPPPPSPPPSPPPLPPPPPSPPPLQGVRP